MKNKISCIISAYNEEKRISKVLSVIVNHPLINEIIVINDGSIDNTERIVRRFRKVKLINLEKNHGKSYAVMKGLIASKNELILLLDADLVGLTKENITKLILPVKNDEVSFSISLRKNPIHSRIIGIDILSGERVFDKSLINIEELKNLYGYGLESYINSKVIQKNKTIKVILWKNVYNVYKSKKGNLIKGIMEDIFMNLRIGPIKEIIQTIYLLQLRKKENEV